MKEQYRIELAVGPDGRLLLESMRDRLMTERRLALSGGLSGHGSTEAQRWSVSLGSFSDADPAEVAALLDAAWPSDLKPPDIELAQSKFLSSEAPAEDGGIVAVSASLTPELSATQNMVRQVLSDNGIELSGSFGNHGDPCVLLTTDSPNNRVLDNKRIGGDVSTEFPGISRPIKSSGIYIYDESGRELPVRTLHNHFAKLVVPPTLEQQIRAVIARVSSYEGADFMSVHEALRIRAGGKPLADQHASITLTAVPAFHNGEVIDALAGLDLEELPPLELEFDGIGYLPSRDLASLHPFQRSLIVMKVAQTSAVTQWRASLIEELDSHGLHATDQYRDVDFPNHVSLVLARPDPEGRAPEADMDLVRRAIAEEGLGDRWPFTPSKFIVQGQVRGNATVVSTFSADGRAISNLDPSRRSVPATTSGPASHRQRPRSRRPIPKLGSATAENRNAAPSLGTPSVLGVALDTETPNATMTPEDALPTEPGIADTSVPDHGLSQ